jgi:hypothetical protein
MGCGMHLIPGWTYRTPIAYCAEFGQWLEHLGDAHSQGPMRAKPLPRHAELAVNLAGTMATFLVATWEARRGS